MATSVSSFLHSTKMTLPNDHFIFTFTNKNSGFITRKKGYASPMPSPQWLVVTIKRNPEPPSPPSSNSGRPCSDQHRGDISFKKKFIYLTAPGLSCSNGIFSFIKYEFSFLTRDGTRPLAVGKWGLSHWTTRDVPSWRYFWPTARAGDQSPAFVVSFPSNSTTFQEINEDPTQGDRKHVHQMNFWQVKGKLEVKIPLRRTPQGQP